MPNRQRLLSQANIENQIYLLRSHRVMLDSDLAKLYAVSTKRLNEQVKRNRNRFPKDFMFQLTAPEVKKLRSRIATSKSVRGGRRYRPFAFTEHGALMLASVLNTHRAIQTSVFVVRAFVRLRRLLTTHVDLARKIKQLEKHYDYQFQEVFGAIRQLLNPPEPRRRSIGFQVASGVEKRPKK